MNESPYMDMVKHRNELAAEIVRLEQRWDDLDHKNLLSERNDVGGELSRLRDKLKAINEQLPHMLRLELASVGRRLLQVRTDLAERVKETERLSYLEGELVTRLNTLEKSA